jgi:hypothetical protein
VWSRLNTLGSVADCLRRTCVTSDHSCLGLQSALTRRRHLSVCVCLFCCVITVTQTVSVCLFRLASLRVDETPVGLQCIPTQRIAHWTCRRRDVIVVSHGARYENRFGDRASFRCLLALHARYLLPCMRTVPLFVRERSSPR